MQVSVPPVVPIAGLLIGFPALVRALLLLDDDPLLAVLGVLAAMAVLLASLRCLNPDESSDSLNGFEDRSRF
jgi:hypothetical protein